ncbi:MAG: stage II sporulation protein M, partial [Bacteroidetes bacterium]|nr:stage II sporulation protein M [Bacteroidota bacterium]
MKEITFLNRNAETWKEFERMVANPSADPDALAKLYIRINDDLSYSRTYYPCTDTTAYLNMLASRAHSIIYKNKRERNSRFVRFWTVEIPMAIYEFRKNLLISFVFFLVAVSIGALSAANDDTFVRLILGDAYVDMTLENINSGDPMAVYKSMSSTDMFAAITVNNIYVSFLCFVFGIFLSAGTFYLLFTNGIMLGAFQYFFYQHGLLGESAATIWIHGTIEISAIVIAGCAGITLGKSILFPGTYSRAASFRLATGKSIKILAGLIPFFIIAGFLESFITRLTDMPLIFKLLIIGTS